MNKIKRLFFGLTTYAVMTFNNISYATSDVEKDIANFELIKYALIFIGIILILLVLVLSYKSDQNQEKKEFLEDIPQKDDDEYDDIETDEEQTLYSAFDENEEMISDTDKKEISEVQADTATSDDFEFDSIFDDTLNNALDELEDFSDISKEETNEIEDSNENIDLDQDFLNQMNESFKKKTSQKNETKKTTKKNNK